MRKQEIMDLLDALEVPYDSRATKDELNALLVEADADHPDDVYVGDVIVADDPRPLPTVGPTGRCLQCGKPADHKHAGV